MLQIQSVQLAEQRKVNAEQIRVLALQIGIPRSVAATVACARPVVRRAMSRHAEIPAVQPAPSVPVEASPSTGGASPTDAPCRPAASFLAASNPLTTITFGSEREYYMNGVRQPAIAIGRASQGGRPGLPGRFVIRPAARLRRQGAGRPASQRTMADVVRRLVEHRPPELVVAAIAGDSDVSHTPATLGSLAGGCADAGLPAHLTLTRPELMTVRAALRLVLEQGNGHRR